MKTLPVGRELPVPADQVVGQTLEPLCTSRYYGKGKSKVNPLYKDWGSVQAVRRVGGVEV
jgi:hypothetical protein